MSILAYQEGQPDYLALAMVVVLLLIVAVMALRKYLALKKGPLQEVSVAAEEVTPVAAADAPTAPGSAGKLKIHDVEPKTAAMLMAITANKLGKPLNELKFISIKEVK